MPEMSMVEKVARAIYIEWSRDAGKEESWEELVQHGHSFVDLARREARAAIEAMRPTNEQILAAIDAWLSEPEGFAIRCERKPDTVELGWLRAAALVGAGVVFPAALSEEVAG